MSSIAHTAQDRNLGWDGDSGDCDSGRIYADVALLPAPKINTIPLREFGS